MAFISVLSETEMEINIPYSAHYKRKHYWGLKEEYQPENKSVRGVYNLRLRLMSFVSIQPLKVSDLGEVVDPGHDSNVMTVRGLEKHIIANLLNSLKNYDGLENEVREIYNTLANIYNKSLAKEGQSSHVKFVISAGFVQIVETNNGNIIGNLSIP